ncbi:helix-turn-helix domain-containing protein [Herbiconiux moechotypicola]|uniref:Helix-turn-helix transcriptional regulator n=1 Tax=Herbiconiux moechotypicola TaxID=637393 RepID=A0ABN3E443_9MICO|nr:helix-turn-helix transcriptional regulator [Herbiconiux moechotypicola]MCS5731626.1 helix-turn-helix domain-containing protein [Herbiconiux moechotypicola]
MGRSIFGDVIARSSATKSELARRADVSRTTVLSVTVDQSRARVDTLRELALALGYDLVIELEHASDPLAAAAARVMLGESDLRATVDDRDLDAWIARLTRYVDADADGRLDTLDLLTEAAGVSAPHHRAGAVLLSGRNDTDRLVSAGRASGVEWALSGSASLEALGADPGKTVVFWAQDAKLVAELLAGTHRRVKTPTAADVIVAPAHPTVFAGSTTIEDVNLVTPVQGVIDAIATGGVDREIAMTLAGSW